MKHWLLAFFCVAALTGCASEYLLVTTDGQILTSDGEPELDEDTGMFEFEDSEGRVQHIPQSQIKQMMER
jgi:hypothetical protein